MLIEQETISPGFVCVAQKLWGAILTCFLLAPAVAQSQNIYGDLWQNAAWQAVSNSANLQYRWILGGTFANGAWSGCKVQVRTTDGSQVTVAINVSFYSPSNEKGALHLTDIIVNGKGAYGANAIRLNEVEIAQMGHQGCAGVSAVAQENKAPAVNNNAPVGGQVLTSYRFQHSQNDASLVSEDYSISAGKATMSLSWQDGTTGQYSFALKDMHLGKIGNIGDIGDIGYEYTVEVKCNDDASCVHRDMRDSTKSYASFMLDFRSKNDADAFLRGMKLNGLKQ